MSRANGMPPGCGRRVFAVVVLIAALSALGTGAALAQQPECDAACVSVDPQVEDVVDVSDNQFGPVLDRVFDDAVGEIGDFRLF